MATMQDVATVAHVSLSTVSSVMNNARPISAARGRIEKPMGELGFRSAAIVRKLASRRSRIIALTFPGIENGLVSAVTAEMVQPSPTTLHSPGAALGRLGLHFLLDHFVSRGPVGGPVLLPCRWEVGHSTGPVSPETLRHR